MRSLHAAVVLLFLQVHLFGQIADFKGMDFSKADSIAQIYKGNDLENLSALSLKLTTSLPSDVEKFRAIYKWVCLNIENDYALYNENRTQREQLSDSVAFSTWSKKFHAKVFRTLVKEKRTICTGYAWLVRELAIFAGIPCRVVDGFGRTFDGKRDYRGIPNHSWNAVQLGGKWYLCDPTWSSGMFDKTSYSFIQRFDEAYFLPDPELFSRNHYPLDSTWLLMKDKPTLKDFFERPVTYANAYHFQLYIQTPIELHHQIHKGEKVSFAFSTPTPERIDDVTLSIGKTITSDVFAHCMDDQGGQYTIDHTFKSKGHYDVHLVVNGNYTLSCTVTVR